MKHLNIYHLKRTEKTGYDEYDEHVVIAKSHKHARGIASGRTGDESEFSWRNPDCSSCKEVGTALESGKPGFICSSYRAG